MTAMVHRPSGLPVVQTTVLDRLIGYVSPERAVRRLHARTLLTLAGGYHGARTDRRATKEWRPRAAGWDTDTLGDLEGLRARSRDLARNAPLAAGAIRTRVTSVIGWGLDPQPRIDRRLLGLSADEARAWQAQIKRLWWVWAGTPSCDLGRQFPFAVLLDLLFRAYLQSGDVLAVQRWQPPQRGELFATRIQLVEADRLCNPDHRPDTDTLIAGIEIDPETGEPLWYHIRDQHPGDLMHWSGGTWRRVAARGAITGDRKVLHFFHPDRPGARRGVPFLSPVIETLLQMTEYGESELTAAVVSSFFTAFVKTETAGMGLTEPAGLPATTSPEEVAKGELRLGPGLVADLGPGESVEIANPMRPNAQFGPFMEQFTSQMGAALGIPYEVLIKRFTSSYSASMAALGEAWREFATDRARVVLGFAQPCYEWMVTEAVLRGYVRAPGFLEDPLARSAWCTATWTGPSKGELRPSEHARAAALRMRAGISTLEQEVAAWSGRDWEENLEQRALEQAVESELGLVPAGAGVEPEDLD